jgi:hypothetical protein
MGGHFPEVMLNLWWDGSAHAIGRGIDKDHLRALLTRNGREPIGRDEAWFGLPKRP